MLSTFASLSINSTKSLPDRQADRSAGKNLIYILIVGLACLPLGMVVGCTQTSKPKTKQSVDSRIAELIERFKDTDSNVLLGMKLLAECGEEGLDTLLEGSKRGSYDGDIEALVGMVLMVADVDAYQKLVNLANDSKPTVRAFACGVMRYTRDLRYLPILAKLKQDNTQLPSSWFTRTVSQRAETAIEKILFYRDNPDKLKKEREQILMIMKE